MIVDAHLHLFRHGYGQFGSGKSPLGELSDLEAYEGLRKRNSIAAGLVVCYEDHGIDPANNAYVRELAAGRPWIHSVAYLRPSPAPTRRQLESLITAGHCGIALYLPDEAAGIQNASLLRLRLDPGGEIRLAKLLGPPPRQR